MTILLFVLVLFILILVHEFGHFIMAKKTGMRVDEFGIGLPPKLFGIKKGETEYTINALPIGGFVKIWGENGEEPFSPVESKASDRQSEAIAEAGEGGTKSKEKIKNKPVVKASQINISADERNTNVAVTHTSSSQEDSPVENEEGEEGIRSVEADSSRAFASRPKWAQALVLVAGVTMNILFAWLLFSITFMIGVHSVVDEADASDSALLYIASTIPDSPASVLPLNSTITSVASGEIMIEFPTTKEFQSLVREAGSHEVEIDYELNGAPSTVSITPVQGLSKENPDKYLLGVSLVMVDVTKESFFTAIVSGFNETLYGIKSIVGGLYTMISGETDFAQVSGPVGIVGMVGEAASYGVTALLTFTAIISLNLAVINLLPFPALDGGRLVFVGIEAITRKKIPPEWFARVNLIGFGLLMLLMVAVTYNDIVRLF